MMKNDFVRLFFYCLFYVASRCSQTAIGYFTLLFNSENVLTPVYWGTVLYHNVKMFKAEEAAKSYQSYGIGVNQYTSRCQKEVIVTVYFIFGQ